MTNYLNVQYIFSNSVHSPSTGRFPIQGESFSHSHYSSCLLMHGNAQSATISEPPVYQEIAYTIWYSCMTMLSQPPFLKGNSLHCMILLHGIGQSATISVLPLYQEIAYTIWYYCMAMLSQPPFLYFLCIRKKPTVVCGGLGSTHDVPINIEEIREINRNFLRKTAARHWSARPRHNFCTFSVFGTHIIEHCTVNCTDKWHCKWIAQSKKTNSTNITNHP